MKLALLSTAALTVVSCVPTPEGYSIPPQHEPVSLKAPPPAPATGEYVRAGDPDADRYFIKDVRPPEGLWRWTLAEPEMRFHLRSSGTRYLHIEFGINDRTFRDTGPVTISFLVNGHNLDRVQYTSFGDKLFEKPVPDEWLIPDGENRVLLRVHNPWQATDPGVKLGVVLQSAGFVVK